MMLSKLIVGILAIILIGLVETDVRAQDPQDIMNGLIQQQLQQYQASHDNRMMQTELEHQELVEKMRYRRETNLEIMRELQRYCPSGNPPCPISPPQSLLQEAAQRGLIALASQPPRQDDHTCLIFGDSAGGGVADCQ